MYYNTAADNDVFFLDVKEAKAGVTLLGNVIIEYIFLNLVEGYRNINEHPEKAFRACKKFQYSTLKLFLCSTTEKMFKKSSMTPLSSKDIVNGDGTFILTEWLNELKKHKQNN